MSASHDLSRRPSENPQTDTLSHDKDADPVTYALYSKALGHTNLHFEYVDGDIRRVENEDQSVIGAGRASIRARRGGAKER